MEGRCAEQLCVVPIFLAGNFLPSLKPKIVYVVSRNVLQEKLTSFFDGLARWKIKKIGCCFFTGRICWTLVLLVHSKLESR